VSAHRAVAAASISLSSGFPGTIPSSSSCKAMEREDYFTRLYPPQDAVLEAFSKVETEFYLTGGTAA